MADLNNKVGPDNLTCRYKGPYADIKFKEIQ